MFRLLITCLINFIVMMLFLGCAATIQKDWQLATTQNTSQAYRDFIKKYPTSNLVGEALTKAEVNKVSKEDINVVIVNTLGGIGFEGIPDSFEPFAKFLPQSQSEQDAAIARILKGEKAIIKLEEPSGLEIGTVPNNPHGRKVGVPTVQCNNGSCIRLLTSGRLYIFYSEDWWEIP
jgi:hypothetical protein